MPTMMATLGLEKLTADQKRQLAGELELDLAEEAPPSPFSLSGLTETQRAELHHRAALSEADPDGGRPWEEIYAEALARLGR